MSVVLWKLSLKIVSHEGLNVLVLIRGFHFITANSFVGHTTSTDIVGKRAHFDREREWSCGHTLLVGFVP